MANPLVDGTSALDPDYQSGGSSSLGEHDTYRQMQAAAKADRTPNFNPEKKNNIIDARDRFGQKNPLASAESAAAKNGAPSGANPSLAEKLPQTANPIKFKGTGRQASKNTNLKGFMKGKGPIAALGIAIGAVGLGMFSMQPALPDALLSRGNQEFNVDAPISRIRTGTLLNFSLNARDVNQGKTVFGNLRLGSRQVARLNANGFNYNPVEYEVNGRTVRRNVLSYTDDNGRVIGLVSKADNLGPGATFGLGVDEVRDFDLARIEDPTLRYKYDAASLTWRGKIALSFNYKIAQVLKRFGLGNKNLFRNWVRDTEATYLTWKGRTSELAELMSPRGSPDLESSTSNVPKNEEDGSREYENTATSTTRIGRTDIDLGVAKVQKAIDIKAKLNGRVVSSLRRVGNIGSGVVCGLMSASSSITSLVLADNLLKGTTSTSATNEALEKLKFGKGAESPGVDLLNGMNAQGPDGNSAMDVISSRLMGGDGIDLSDESALQANTESFINALPTGTFTSSSLTGCTIARVASAAVGAVIDLANIVLDIVAIVGSLGGAAPAVIAKDIAIYAGKELAGAAGQVFISLGISWAVQQAMEFAINAAVKSLIKENAPDLVSVCDETTPNCKTQAGHDYVKFSDLMFKKQAQGNGGSPTTTYGYVKLIEAQQDFIAQTAEFERATRSPFDITSEHTFLGSIVYKALPLSLSFSSLSSGLNGIFNTLGSSFASIIPSAAAQSAITETNITTKIGNCPLLESVGTIGNEYCDPIYGTDFSTINLDPEDVFNQAAISKDNKDNFEKDDSGEYKLKDGNPIIAENSELMKFIVSCQLRDSQFGIVDQNILNYASGKSTTPAANIASAGVGAIPVIGDVKDIIDALTESSNRNWATGESCIADNGDWDKYKYYERYLNDQEQMESMGMVEESASTIAIERYYEKHPLDQSYEGQLARISGMTKDQVVATLDYVKYLDFVASYNPSDRLPVEAPIIPTITDLIPEVEIASHSNKIGGVLVSFVYNPVFLPLRDRAVASA
jgi:hypothetical protein